MDRSAHRAACLSDQGLALSELIPAGLSRPPLEADAHWNVTSSGVTARRERLSSERLDGARSTLRRGPQAPPTRNSLRADPARSEPPATRDAGAGGMPPFDTPRFAAPPAQEDRFPV